MTHFLIISDSKGVTLRRDLEAKSPLSLNRSLFSQSAIGIGDASRADDRLSLPQGSRSPTRMLSHPYARPNTLSLAGSLMKGMFYTFH